MPFFVCPRPSRRMNLPHRVVFGLGSNLGDRLHFLDLATSRLAGVGQLVACSGTFESPSWGYTDPQQYLNRVVILRTNLGPEALLTHCQTIEEEAGRTRPGKAYSARTLDIDLLFFDDLVRTTPHLVLPHPRLHLRNFVLVPLCQVDPNLVHPILGKTIRALMAESPDSAFPQEVVPISPTFGPK